MTESPGNPVILVVATPEHHAALADEFASRYARDYDLHVVQGGSEAYELKHYLMSEGRQIALIAVDHSLEGGALPMLDKLRVASPASRRVALVPVSGFAAALDELRPALGQGRLDTYLIIPQGARDEEFHTAISEYLSDWSWSSTAPVVAGVPHRRRRLAERGAGDPRLPRSHGHRRTSASIRTARWAAS